MALNLEECDTIIAAVEANGVLLQLGFMRRFDPEFVARQRHRGGRDRAPHADQSLTQGPGLPPAGRGPQDVERELAEVNSHDWDCVRMADGIRLRASIRRSANFKGAARGVDTDISTITSGQHPLRERRAGSISGVCPCDYGYDARVEIVARRASCRSATCAGRRSSSARTRDRACSRRSTHVAQRFEWGYIREIGAFRTGIQDGIRRR